MKSPHGPAKYPGKWMGWVFPMALVLVAGCGKRDSVAEQQKAFAEMLKAQQETQAILDKREKDLRDKEKSQEERLKEIKGKAFADISRVEQEAQAVRDKREAEILTAQRDAHVALDKRDKDLRDREKSGEDRLREIASREASLREQEKKQQDGLREIRTREESVKSLLAEQKETLAKTQEVSNRLEAILSAQKRVPFIQRLAMDVAMVLGDLGVDPSLGLSLVTGREAKREYYYWDFMTEPSFNAAMMIESEDDFHVKAVARAEAYVERKATDGRRAGVQFQSRRLKLGDARLIQLFDARMTLPQTGAPADPDKVSSLRVSVPYHFTQGKPRPSDSFLLVIERAKGPSARLSVTLKPLGILNQVVNWGPEQGPFRMYIEDSNGEPISASVPLDVRGP